MMKGLRIFLLLWLVAACTVCTLAASRMRIAAITQEEYAVYSAAIDALYNQDPLVVVQDYTGLGRLMSCAELKPFESQELEQHAELIAAEMPLVDPELIHELRDANQQTYQMGNSFDVIPEVVLINAQERLDIFGSACFSRQGWSFFHRPYSGAGGIVMFSRVGFNHSMDKALVFLARQVDFNWDERFYLYLEKINGEWILRDKLG